MQYVHHRIDEYREERITALYDAKALEMMNASIAAALGGSKFKIGLEEVLGYEQQPEETRTEAEVRKDIEDKLRKIGN